MSLNVIPYNVWHLAVVSYGGNSIVLTMLQSVIYFLKIMKKIFKKFWISRADIHPFVFLAFKFVSRGNIFFVFYLDQLDPFPKVTCTFIFFL
jgi:hypothetical protein